MSRTHLLATLGPRPDHETVALLRVAQARERAGQRDTVVLGLLSQAIERIEHRQRRPVIVYRRAGGRR